MPARRCSERSHRYSQTPTCHPESGQAITDAQPKALIFLVRSAGPSDFTTVAASDNTGLSTNATPPGLLSLITTRLGVINGACKQAAALVGGKRAREVVALSAIAP